MDNIKAEQFSLAYPRNILATLIGFAAFLVFATMIAPVSTHTNLSYHTEATALVVSR